MSHDIDVDRRRLIQSAALSVAATQLCGSALSYAQSNLSKAGPSSPIGIGTAASFGALKQVDAGVLRVGYAEAGPPDAPAVILLHGWPYDIHAFVEVTALLASAGYRVVVPYVRGYGTTRFLAAEAPRNGQQSVLAVDTLALMDSLKIKKAVLAGFDWGGRTADIVAALWPERCCDREDTVTAKSGTAVVVSVLLCDRARSRRIREIPARFCQAHLDDRITEMEFRRRNFRAYSRLFR
jgi:pimeloyl-ACP methyl ester carboxylesterase